MSRVLAVMWLVVALMISSAGCGDRKPSKAGAAAGMDPRIAVAVDRRVELISIVCRLAGYAEYRKPIATAYARAVDEHFAAFRDHPAVAAAAELRRVHDISFNAPMGLAVYLDATLAPRRPLTPPLPGLDARWNRVDMDAFVFELQDFARASDFERFFTSHAAFHAAVEARIRTALDGYRVIDWFDAQFGPRPTSTFRVIPGLLTGDMAYAAAATDDDGTQEVVQVLYLPPPGDDGIPAVSEHTVYLLIHEFAHSYVNPILDARAAIVLPAAEPLFTRHAAVMSRQHYPSAAIMANESLVRALVVLYAHDRGPKGADAYQLLDETQRGFLWTRALADATTALPRPFTPDDLAATTRDVFAAWTTAHP